MMRKQRPHNTNFAGMGEGFSCGEVFFAKGARGEFRHMSFLQQKTDGAQCAVRLMKRQRLRRRCRNACGLAVRQHRQEQQRHDVRNLDHRVDGRTSGILVRIADGIAGHGCFVGF